MNDTIIDTSLPVVLVPSDLHIEPASSVEPIETIQPTKTAPNTCKNAKRGRPVKYKKPGEAQAARQKKDRDRKHRQKLKTVPTTDSVHDWNIYLKTIGLGMDRGLIMEEAPSNAVGLLVTGGLSTVGCAPGGLQMDTTAPPLFAHKKKLNPKRRR
jgi:hypothetical protein